MLPWAVSWDVATSRCSWPNAAPSSLVSSLYESPLPLVSRSQSPLLSGVTALLGPTRSLNPPARQVRAMEAHHLRFGISAPFAAHILNPAPVLELHLASRCTVNLDLHVLPRGLIDDYVPSILHERCRPLTREGFGLVRHLIRSC